MKKALLFAALIAAGCHTVPDDMGEPDMPPSEDVAMAEEDVGQNADVGTTPTCDEPEFLSKVLFDFGEQVDLRALWTDGEVGWVVGSQERLGTTRAAVWEVRDGDARLVWDRVDRDDTQFLAIDCLSGAEPICVAAGSNNTSAGRNATGEWIDNNLSGRGGDDVAATSSGFVVVEGEIYTASGPSTEEWTRQTGPELRRVDCTDGFCVGATDAQVFVTGATNTWDGLTGWDLPCEANGCDPVAVETPAMDIGFVATNQGHLYATADGTTWAAIATKPTLPASEELSMLTPEHGWMLNDDASILRTDDGGENWSNVPTTALQVLNSSYIHLHDVDAAWVIDRAKVTAIYKGCP